MVQSAAIPCITKRSCIIVFILLTSPPLYDSFSQQSAATTTAISSLGFSDDVLDTLALAVANVIVQSDNKRETTGFDGASTGWTSWVDEGAAAHLSSVMEQVRYNSSSSSSSCSKWLRWLQSSPTCALVELSTQLRTSVVEQLPNVLSKEKSDKPETGALGSPHDSGFTTIPERVGMRLIHLPSGSSLTEPLTSPPGAMIYGLAMSGGITRFRLIGTEKQRRRAGERTVMLGSTGTERAGGDVSWLQYGGPSRNYEAIDMGPGLLLEVILLPSGLSLPMLDNTPSRHRLHDMVLTSAPWHPGEYLAWKFNLLKNTDASSKSTAVPEFISVSDLETTFCTTIGGLRPQIDEIIRRVLDGRVFRGAQELSEGGMAANSTLDRIRRDEMQGLLELGLQPVRGLLLYGPPGCGKTKLAREISNILDARPPKIVDAPDLLDRWVGGTEQLVRGLFEDAEIELHQTCQGDATQSGLHVIVVDEIDAVFRRRSSQDSASEVTRASAVNQILAKLDGVSALNNILFIGLTNRRELLDPALLRPGRLETQILIPLPDTAGRREILHVLFRELRHGERLSQHLCEAIDGIHFTRAQRVVDLASNRLTGGFSGADLAGLVRNAGSIALDRCRKQGQGGIGMLIITLDDTMKALGEVKLTTKLF